MNRIILGLVGPIASGKGEVARYLKQHGFLVSSLSDRVREEAVRRGLDLSRENLQNIGNELRRSFGGHVLAERTINLLGDEPYVVVDSIRNPAEIEFLRQYLNITIIGIDAPTENRLAWYLHRSVIRGEDGLTVEDFVRANNRDLGQGETEFGQQVSRCLSMADAVVLNEGSKRHLLEEIEYVLISRFHLGPEGIRRSKEK